MGACKWLRSMCVAAIWRKLAAVSGLGGQYWGCQQDECFANQDTPVATTPLQDLPAFSQAFFARPAEVVEPELIDCLLVKSGGTS